MSDQTYSFEDPRVQELVQKFRHATADINMTKEARQVLETYFYANCGKFFLSGQLDRLLTHWERSFETFISTVKSRATNGEIDGREMRDAITGTATYYRTYLASADDVKAEDKIPPPQW